MQAMKLPLTLHKNQHYLVVGLGMTGYSVACHLLQHGYQCSIQDDRELPPYLKPFVEQFPAEEVIQAPLEESMLKGIDCLVVSPGLSIRTNFMKKVEESGKRIIGDIELFAEAVDKPVLAITGSNGKSTVTSLLGEMISADGYQVGVGGNIGVPALDLLEKNVDFYVLELSSFQLETTTSLKPLVSTVLNISEDHMDRYDDITDYKQCKKTIYRGASHCVSNQDDVLTEYSAQDKRFSIQDKSADYSIIDDAEPMLAVRGEGWLKTKELKLKGRHNWANCLAAMAMAEIAGISKKAIIKALRTYPGLVHRSQWVAEINGVNWINDSKATNPGATKAAIEGINDPVILLAGGQAKGAQMSILCDSLKQHVKTVLLFGEDADDIEKSWQDCVDIERVEDLQQAVKRAAQLAVAGDLVLLAPACASFDMYDSFAKRGEHFITLVRSML